MKNLKVVRCSFLQPNYESERTNLNEIGGGVGLRLDDLGCSGMCAWVWTVPRIDVARDAQLPTEARDEERDAREDGDEECWGPVLKVVAAVAQCPEGYVDVGNVAD